MSSKRLFTEVFGSGQVAKRDNFIDLCDDMLDIIYNMTTVDEYHRCRVMQLVNRHWQVGYWRYFLHRFGVKYSAFLVTYRTALFAGHSGGGVLPSCERKHQAPWAVLGSIRLGDDPMITTVIGPTHRRAWRRPTLYRYGRWRLLPGRQERERSVGRFNADVLVAVAVSLGRRNILRACITALGAIDLPELFDSIIAMGTADQLEDHIGMLSHRLSHNAGPLLDAPGTIYKKLPRDGRTLAMFTVLVRQYLQDHAHAFILEDIFNGRFPRVPQEASEAAIRLLPDGTLILFTNSLITYSPIVADELRQRCIPMPRPREYYYYRFV
jgi:hypothetical protein